MPHDQPRPHVFLNREEVELLPDDAVVALPRLFEPMEVLLQRFLGEPRRPVDALEHLAPLVAAPVRARGMQQLEMLDLAGAGNVRAAAQVHERAVGVHRNDLVFFQIIDSLELERIILEALFGVGARYLLAHERVIGFHHLGHFLFDRLDVLGRKRPPDIEVVVEPVLDRRPEADLGLGEQLPDSRRQRVRRRVAQHVQCLRVLVRENRDGGAVGERALQVAHVAVHADGECGLGEPGPDRFGKIGARRARRQAFLAPIRQDDLNLGRGHV